MFVVSIKLAGGQAPSCARTLTLVLKSLTILYKTSIRYSVTLSVFFHCQQKHTLNNLEVKSMFVLCELNPVKYFLIYVMALCKCWKVTHMLKGPSASQRSRVFTKEFAEQAVLAKFNSWMWTWFQCSHDIKYACSITLFITCQSHKGTMLMQFSKGKNNGDALGYRYR